MATSGAIPFIESFKFVEDSSPQLSVVPNHLLESKIYAKVQQNAAIKASPAVVHFEGVEVGKKFTAVVSLCNVAREVVRLHIIPPQTSAFSIKYTKGERLVPGMTMTCKVEFTADEYRYYYDAIRIHCPGEDNLIIPIHAYPVMDTADYPLQLKFPQTAIGDMRAHVITLRCHVPIEFEYQLKKLQDDEAFSVTPLSGIIPPNGDAEIVIKYQPMKYSTSIMMLQLVTSQFNSKPSVCTITGHCEPGMNAVKNSSANSLAQNARRRVASPLERSRQRKMSRKSLAKVSKENTQVVKKMVDGIRLPEKMETVHHVSSVLLQTPGKMTLKELIEAEKSVSGRQMKENRFEQAMRKNVYEERQNQLRWQVKLGDTAMTSSEKSSVVAERENAWSAYKVSRGDPDPVNEQQRKDTESLWRRTIRDASELAEEGIQFDLYTNNPWATRHNVTDRFTQAARKIILRNRAKKNLGQLNSFLKNWNKKQETLDDGAPGSGNPSKSVPVIDSDDEDESAPEAKLASELSHTRVTHTKYPFFVPPNKKDEMAPDALNDVVTYETQVDMISRTPYFNLQVPQQSKLLGYSDHEIHLGYDYVEPVLARELRTGAQEEIIDITKPYEASVEASVEREADLADVEAGQKRPSHGRAQFSAEIREEEAEDRELSSVSLTPPEAMLKPIEYPPLHIFNATPGLQVFQSPVPYAEVDSDYHLCPLPRYTMHRVEQSQQKQTQKQFLDRQDVIKGTMSWKRFPSQGLTSLANTPTLTNVWAPRWSDPFSNNLLPHQVPDLQFGLSDSDVLEYGEAGSEDEEDEELQLTPEMVTAQFSLIERAPSTSTTTKQTSGENFPYDNKIPSTYLPVSSNGPVPRERRESELEFFLSKRSNRLGQKFKNKIDQLNSITNRNDLVLK